jgi:hypothetical protein
MLALVAGCKARDTSGAGKPTNPHSWAPDKLTSIQDVPAKEIETLIQKKLDGPRPGRNSGAAENRQRLSEGVT